MKIWISAIFMFVVVFSMMHILVAIYGYSILLLGFLILVGALIFTAITKYMKIFSSDQKEYVLGMFPESMRFLRKLITILVLN